MTNWAKVIEGKIRIARQGAKPSKPSGDARMPGAARYNASSEFNLALTCK
jgi:hypothetical protein